MCVRSSDREICECFGRSSNSRKEMSSNSSPGFVTPDEAVESDVTTTCSVTENVSEATSADLSTSLRGMNISSSDDAEVQLVPVVVDGAPVSLASSGACAAPEKKRRPTRLVPGLMTSRKLNWKISGREREARFRIGRRAPARIPSRHRPSTMTVERLSGCMVLYARDLQETGHPYDPHRVQRWRDIPEQALSALSRTPPPPSANAAK